MLKNYFEIAFTKPTKNKIYSFINTHGLSTERVLSMLMTLRVNKGACDDCLENKLPAIHK